MGDAPLLGRRMGNDEPAGLGAPAGLALDGGSADALVFVRAGLVPYEEAWAEQRRLHAARLAGEVPDTVLLLEHPSVYTAGRRTEAWERPSDGTPVIDVDRGGKITWHGPGQLVGYPILALPDPVDVVAYVRRLEAALIAACAELGLATTRVAGRSGVWVPADDHSPDRKVAAIGIRVSRRVTMHGFALNCDPDLTAFSRIVACGISDAGVTSLTTELGRRVGVAETLDIVQSALLQAGLTAPTPTAGIQHLVHAR
jgi:lipoyl(octanoyl) transferase